MTSRVYAYLRASTTQQDATRAKGQLDEFATANGMT
ncbi:resolvase, partial [Klebsiella pneumoniae]|nr:resolvase [Klebsiella pneumoniae]